MQLIHLAVTKKQAAEVVRLAKTEHLTRAQRSWAYTQAGRLTIETDREMALQLWEDATKEALRIDETDPDRARALVAVIGQFATFDSVRAWELMTEVAKAANAAPSFTGANSMIRHTLFTAGGLKVGSIGGEDYGLSKVSLAKSFKGEAPRATATLAAASQILNP